MIVIVSLDVWCGLYHMTYGVAYGVACSVAYGVACSTCKKKHMGKHEQTNHKPHHTSNHKPHHTSNHKPHHTSNHRQTTSHTIGHILGVSLVVLPPGRSPFARMPVGIRRKARGDGSNPER